jgi:Raf kinase inhibitor-like YbhB/YbcL family protein
MTFALTSPAFGHNSEIPTQYTCEGADISPPLRWSGTPQGTQSFALIVDDPDAPDPRAPRMTWVHWVLVDIPGDTRELAENAAIRGLPRGAYQGLNDWKRAAYGGPCPPIGKHRYFHKLYALSAVVPRLRQPTAAQVLAAMKGHVIAQTQLIGLYEKHASAATRS